MKETEQTWVAWSPRTNGRSLGRDRCAQFSDRRREEVTPYGFVQEIAGGVFGRCRAGRDGAVRAFDVAVDVEAGSEAARVAVGRGGRIDVHYRTEAVET